MHDDTELVTRFLGGRDLPCPRCGFNLRGVRDAVCPECGRRLGLSMLLLHEQHAIPRADWRAGEARRHLRVSAGGLLLLAHSIGVMSFPSVTGLLVAAILLALACACEWVSRWYRRRLEERAMHESLASGIIDRYALVVSVLLAIPGVVAGLTLVAWVLVRVIGV